MANYSLRRFSRPEPLRAIDPTRLTDFLRPHRGFLAARGLTFPGPGTPRQLDYQGLVRAFLSPDEQTPRDLIAALCLVDEMATADGMDSLLAEAERQGIKLNPDSEHSP